MPKPISRVESLGSAHSMQQVKALTGMPNALIKAMKEAGCTAFNSGGRVNISELLRFFFESYNDGDEKPPDGLATWREALNRSQTKRSDLELAKETGIVLTKEEITKTVQEFCGIFFGSLKRLRQEAPRDFEMRPKDYIAKGMDEKLEQLTEQAKRSVDEFLKADAI
jgi:hypothetical protein